jgi:hypothetical protein
MNFFVFNFDSSIFDILIPQSFTIGIRYPLISIIYLHCHCTFIVVNFHFFKSFFGDAFIDSIMINLCISFIYQAIFDCNFEINTNHCFDKCYHQFLASFGFECICLLITIGC